MMKEETKQQNLPDTKESQDTPNAKEKGITDNPHDKGYKRIFSIKKNFLEIGNRRILQNQSRKE